MYTLLTVFSMIARSEMLSSIWLNGKDLTTATILGNRPGTLHSRSSILTKNQRRIIKNNVFLCGTEYLLNIKFFKCNKIA